MAIVDIPVESARQAVVGTAEQVGALASTAWEQAHELVGEAGRVVEADVVAPISRAIKDRVASDEPSGPSPWLLALVAVLIIIIGGGVLVRRRRQAAERDVQRAGARTPDAPPDAFGAGVTAAG